MWKFFNGKLFNSQSRSVTSAAFILALASLGSRFLGLVRDRLLAGQFGAGDTLDIYYAAFRIPDLIYNLLVLGALSAGFVPIFVSLWQDEKARQDAWKFVNSLLNILLLGLMVLGILFFIFAPFLMKLITPGYAADKMAAVVMLTRIMFFSPLLLGLSTVFGGVLQSAKRFLIFSLTPIFYNLGIIFGIIFFVPRWGISGLAYGVVLGAFLHLIVQLPTLKSLGYRYCWMINWRNSGVQRLAKLIIPRVLTIANSQLTFLAITVLASGLAAGSLAVFNLAYNIWTFPMGLFASSLAVAVFPNLSAAAAKKDKAGFAKMFSESFRQILFLIVPASFLLVVLRAQIVRVILGTGKFDWSDTIFTISALQYLCIGLFAESLMLLLIRGFFAFEDTKTPFWLGLIGSICRIFGAWLFGLYYGLGVAGLALGYSIGGIFNMFLLWFFLRRKVGDLDEKEIFWSGLKIVVASLIAGFGAWLGLRLINNFVNNKTFIGIFSQGLGAGLIGIIIYFLAGFILRLKEMLTFWQGLKNRLPFKTLVPDKELIDN